MIEAEKFLGIRLPDNLREKYQCEIVSRALNQKEMMAAVDLKPPFLRTEKMVIFGNKFEESKSIGIGRIYLEDTDGHYNKTIYLALAGRLMPSTALIHLGAFFPNTNPQAFEGKSIRMDSEAYNNGLLQPGKNGSTFYVETIVRKKKINLVIVDTYIMFGSAKFGLIEELKFILTKKDSILSAVEVPEVGNAI